MGDEISLSRETQTIRQLPWDLRSPNRERQRVTISFVALLRRKGDYDEKVDHRGSKGFSEKAVDRRTFLKIAAGTVGPLVIGGVPSVNLFAADASIGLEDPAYEALYSNFEGRFMKDPRWVEQTLPRLQWPKAGERVPEFRAGIQNVRPFSSIPCGRWPQTRSSWA